MYADREYYEKLMPYYEGTKNDIDYDRLKELLDMYWNSIWNWVKENGNQLWI
jgi:Zn-dependent M16 (insulinase) family peptidase